MRSTQMKGARAASQHVHSTAVAQRQLVQKFDRKKTAHALGLPIVSHNTLNNTSHVVAVVLTLPRIVKSVVTGQAPVTMELRNTPGKNTNNPRWYTHIQELTHFMLPLQTYGSQIGSQPTFVPGPYWCTRLTTCAWKNRLMYVPCQHPPHFGPLSCSHPSASR